MTKRALFWNVFWVMVLLFTALALSGFVVLGGEALGLEPAQIKRLTDAGDWLVPLLIAVPAGWLAFCFQRRLSYIAALRQLWERLVRSVQQALHYTRLAAPGEGDHVVVLMDLSCAIDDVRAVFRNVRENDEEGRHYRQGQFPFEGIKEIYRIVEALGHGASATPEKRADARRAIATCWLDMRLPLLREFDRPSPTYFHIRAAR